MVTTAVCEFVVSEYSDRGIGDMKSSISVLRGAVGFSLLASMVLMEAPTTAQQIALEEIVVTARKREESLQEIPLAISAFTSRQLEELGAANLVDLSKFTPGLQFNEQGVQEPGRVYTAIRFRGLGSEIKEPFGQIGSAFLDGIYMSNGVSSLGTELFERIEVVKGPSSAWLGRSTFSGAVNFITKTPSTEEFSGRATGKYAENGTYDMSFSFEGPIVKDKLAFRAYVRGYNTNGEYQASDGGELGAESTETFMGTLYATPNDQLTVKMRALYSRDDDSAPAQAFISGPLGLRGENNTGLTNCFADGVTGPSLFRRNTPALGNVTDMVCGRIPNDLSIVDSNTTLHPDFIRFWNEIVPQVSGVPRIDHVGLRRNQQRYSANIDYDFDVGGFFEGASAHLLAGYFKEGVAFIRDFDLTPAPNWLSRDPSLNDGKQFEATLESGQDSRLTWLLGVSYFDASFKATYQGGNVIVGTDAGLTVPIPTFDLGFYTGGGFDGVCPCTFPPLQRGPTTSNETLGIFGQVGFDFTDQLGLDFEWRWQKDEIAVQLVGADDLSGFPAPVQALGTGNGGELGDTFKKFLPRITLQYQPRDATNFWATFSRGNNPGYFNGDIVNRTASDIFLILAQVDTDIFIGEEQLDNFELGWKQQLMDNRVNFSLVGYHMKWKNQKTRTGANIFRPDGSQIALNATISGFATEFFGLELEGSAALTENVTFSGSVNYANAEFKNFECGFTDDFFVPPNGGTVQICDGNRPVQSPAWSGHAALTYADTFVGDWDYFVRADATHTGKRYTDEANFAYIGTQVLVNLRIGFVTEDVRIEGFVTNLANDKTWAAGNRWTDFSADRGGLFPFEFTEQQGIALTAPRKRQFGLRASYNF